MFTLTEYDVQKIKDRTIILENGCYDWKGTKDKDGYSIVWLSGKNVKLHRLMYYLYYKTLDTNLQVTHKCNNRHCFNPLHLVQGTHQENIKYRVDCNRTHKHIGSKNGNSKLTEDIVKEIIIRIYNNEFIYLSQVAKEYDISRSILQKILNGYYWKEITDQLVVPLSQIKQKIYVSK